MNTRVRVIPILTIVGNKLVKTVRFKNPNYIGDPLNAIKIFNEKRVDELVVLDIDASRSKAEPNYKLIYDMAGEAFMPIGYGGGIRTLEQAKKIFGLGIEKVVLNSILLENPELITAIADIYGSQSVVVSLDIKRGLLGELKPCFISGKKTLPTSIRKFAQNMINLGAGEIIVHNTDREGTFKGFDIDLLREVKSLSVPIVALGGCNSVDNMKEALNHGADAIAVGSLFVYKNNDPKSILINYTSLKIIN